MWRKPSLFYNQELGQHPLDLHTILLSPPKTGGAPAGTPINMNIDCNTLLSGTIFCAAPCMHDPWKLLVAPHEYRYLDCTVASTLKL